MVLLSSKLISGIQSLANPPLNRKSWKDNSHSKLFSNLEVHNDVLHCSRSVTAFFCGHTALQKTTVAYRFHNSVSVWETDRSFIISIDVFVMYAIEIVNVCQSNVVFTMKQGRCTTFNDVWHDRLFDLATTRVSNNIERLPVYEFVHGVSLILYKRADSIVHY